MTSVFSPKTNDFANLTQQPRANCNILKVHMWEATNRQKSHFV